MTLYSSDVLNTLSTPPPALHGLRLRQLVCRRGNRLLFSRLDLDVGAGQIVWVRGRNGRGKTSLLRLAAGLSTPESGEVLWGNLPARRDGGYARQLAFVGHTNALKEDLTVTEALQFLLRIHAFPSDLASVHGALERIGLQGRRGAMVRTLSQGQRRRVALARLALANDASMWVLDEPFDALDGDGVERLNGLLVEHAGRGGAVLLTSHQSLDAQRLQPREVDLDRYS
jgi:heme exporter protein A